MEIERKFTVKEVPDLSKYDFHVMEQGYLNTDPVVRVRKEDDKYYYIVHDELKFNNAEANVELEVEFEFDLRDIERTAQICDVKPSYFGSIRLSLSTDENDNEWEEIHPYEDDKI